MGGHTRLGMELTAMVWSGWSSSLRPSLEEMASDAFWSEMMAPGWEVTVGGRWGWKRMIRAETQYEGRIQKIGV